MLGSGYASIPSACLFIITLKSHADAGLNSSFPPFMYRQCLSFHHCSFSITFCSREVFPLLYLSIAFAFLSVSSPITVFLLSIPLLLFTVLYLRTYSEGLTKLCSLFQQSVLSVFPCKNISIHQLHGLLPTYQGLRDLYC